MTIKAVTFDLWDTIIDDDSDEPKRRALGLRAKADERRHLLWRALDRAQPVPFEDVRRAYDAADAAFMRAWKADSVTWTIAERLEVALRRLGRSLPEADLQGLVEALGRMEVEVPPDPVPGAEEALQSLSQRYRLGVVSDTIVTPGTQLRALLEVHGLGRHFTGFAFSDEVGRSKPYRAMFESAAGQLGVDFAEMVHVGDRDHNDVKGPQALGMKTVLFTARRDVDKDITSADAICERHADLPRTIDALAG